jgi:hypothetical protein
MLVVDGVECSPVSLCEPDPATAAIARDALLAPRYRSTQDVLNELNARDIPIPQGAVWTGPRSRAMAFSDVYARTWRYGAIAVTVEPLLTADEAG